MKLKSPIKVIFALLVLALLIYLVDLEQLWGCLSKLTLEAAYYLAIISILLLYISAMKWGYFLEAFGSKVPVFKLFNLYVLGYFVNLIAPSYLGGDAIRSWYLGKSVGQHKSLTATILERFTGLVAMVLLALVFMWFAPAVTVYFKLAVLGVAFALLLLCLLSLSSGLLTWIKRKFGVGKLVSHLEKIQEGFILAKNDKTLLVKSMLLSLLFHSITVINVLAAAYAVGWFEVPVWDLFVVLPLILLIGALPLAPNSLGIQEGAYYFFLTAIGATPEQALGLGIVLRAKSYVIGLFGGIIWLRLKSHREQVATTSQPA